MPTLQKGINGLYKGVTRQEASNRLEGQVEESVNMIHAVERGVSRRNPTELVNESLEGLVDSGVFLHSYERGSGGEEYLVAIQNGTLFVYDKDGIRRTVVADAGTLDYLSFTNGAEASEVFKSLTVGDTTFIVNNTKIVEMDSLVDGIIDEELNNPFYYVKRSFDNGAGTGYDYTLNGSTVNATKTSTAVNSLLTALGPTNYQAFGSILVRKTKPTSWVWSDSYGSQASQGFWGTATKIEDLPITLSGAENTYNFKVKIQGVAKKASSVYWVEYEDEHWKETVQPALQNTIKKDTMPLKLVSLADGTFTLQFIDWDKRKKGDEITASKPSFIDNQITDIFFFKNRLCFTSAENVIMSETAKYFNFFPTTVTDILDSDPIDVAVDSNSVALLRHAIPFNNSVILLSSESQFSLQADKVLSPNDVSVSNISNYNVQKSIKPIALGSSMYFMSQTLKTTSLREYYVEANGNSNTAVDISSHVSGYIPNTIKSMVGNTNKDIVFLMPENSTELFVYKFFSDGQERLQTAWSKWVFGGTIKGMTLLGNYLFIIIKRGINISLERINYASPIGITDYRDNGTITYESYITLSETVIKDGEGRLIQSAGSPLMLKTLQVKGTKESVYEIQITDKIKTRVAKGFAVKDNKILLQGKTNEVKLRIQSVDNNPLEFHTYNIEILHNNRAKVI